MWIIRWSFYCRWLSNFCSTTQKTFVPPFEKGFNGKTIPVFLPLFSDCQWLHPPVWCVGWRRGKVSLRACLSKVSDAQIHSRFIWMLLLLLSRAIQQLLYILCPFVCSIWRQWMLNRLLSKFNLFSGYFTIPKLVPHLSCFVFFVFRKG